MASVNATVLAQAAESSHVASFFSEAVVDARVCQFWKRACIDYRLRIALDVRIFAVWKFPAQHLFRTWFGKLTTN